MKRKLYAQMWWCHDYECDCTEPTIVEKSDGYYQSPGWEKPKVIEAGPFRSQATIEEAAEQRAWLIEKAKFYNVENLEEVLKEYNDQEPL